MLIMLQLEEHFKHAILSIIMFICNVNKYILYYYYYDYYYYLSFKFNVLSFYFEFLTTDCEPEPDHSLIIT